MAKEKRNRVKFMQVLSWEPFFRLRNIAKQRGIAVQELLRVVVIPDWLEAWKAVEKDRRCERLDRNRKRRRR